MRRGVRILVWSMGLYALAWVAYVAKSAAGVDLIAADASFIGGHHGAWFPGSDPVVESLRVRGR